MNVAGKYEGMTAEASMRPTLATLVERLEELSKHLHQIESNGCELADRLGGSQPRPINSGDNAKASSDLLSQLHSLVAECSSKACSVSGEIERIRGVIG